MLRKRTDTPELREYWAFVERTAAEVATWPAWKRGEKSMIARHKNQAVLFAKSHYAGYPILSATGLGAHTECEFNRDARDMGLRVDHLEADGLYIWEGEVFYLDEEVRFRGGGIRPATPADLANFGTPEGTLEFHASEQIQQLRERMAAVAA
jgi:hypothetical protein